MTLYLGHRGHRRSHLHICSFVGPSSQCTWCGWCSAPNYIYLHTSHLQLPPCTFGAGLLNVSVFTLGTVVVNVQEAQDAHEDQEDHPLAGTLTNWRHCCCCFTTPLRWTNHHHLPLIQLIPLLIKFFFLIVKVYKVLISCRNTVGTKRCSALRRGFQRSWHVNQEHLPLWPRGAP